MKKIKKEWGKTILIGLIILSVALFLRFYKLILWPVFADEAIYIRWSQIMSAEPTLRFLPLSDGKQPLFMWILMTYINYLKDPLFSGRAISAIAGIGSIIGIFSLSYILFGRKDLSISASLLWALSPYPLFFERMALVDALLTMFFIWTATFAVITAKTKRIDAAIMTGFFLGGALLTKSSGIFTLILLPPSILLTKLPKKGKVFDLLKLGSLFIIPIVIAFVMYSVQRLGPNFHLLTSRTKDYMFPLVHILQSPLDPAVPYFHRAWQWIFKMGPNLLPVMFFLGLLIGFKKYWRENTFLLTWFLIPLLVQVELGKVFTARYILFLLPPIYLVATEVFLVKKELIKKLAVLLLFAFIIVASIFNWKMLSDPIKTPLPPGERQGYLEEWTSGIGVREVSEYIKKVKIENPDRNIVIGTEGSFGTLPDGLQMYLEGLQNVTTIGLGLNINSIPSSLTESIEAGNLTYFVANDSRFSFDDEENYEVIAKYDKVPRRTDSHEYSLYGPQDSLYLIQIK